MFDQFPPNSRYHRVALKTLERRGRGNVVYLARRFLPLPETLSLLQEHVVEDRDRLDNLAARYLGDPELFWRIADANNAMRPQDLTAEEEIGRRLRITLPEGLVGPA